MIRLGDEADDQAPSLAFLHDVPVVGDFDGDGTTDVPMYRRDTGVWYIRLSSDGSLLQVPWGSPFPDDDPVCSSAFRTFFAF